MLAVNNGANLDSRFEIQIRTLRMTSKNVEKQRWSGLKREGFDFLVPFPRKSDIRVALIGGKEEYRQQRQKPLEKEGSQLPPRTVSFPFQMDRSFSRPHHVNPHRRIMFTVIISTNGGARGEMRQKTRWGGRLCKRERKRRESRQGRSKKEAPRGKICNRKKKNDSKKGRG